MKIGIGTYALYWEFQNSNPNPLDIPGMVDRAAQLGCEVFQICDDPRIEDMEPERLAALRDQAAESGIELELGTRTVGRTHLSRYVDIAGVLGASTLRSMIQRQEIADGQDAAVKEIRALLPRLEDTGITLALETYEQLPTPTLLEIIDAVGSPLVGICLDPANCVSALEHPRQVVDSCARRTANLHVKDFAFARQEGWVGFTYSGAPLGEGLLDLDHELRSVYLDRPIGSGHHPPSAVVEHWLPWQGDLQTTLATERAWTDRTLTALRAWRGQHTL